MGYKGCGFKVWLLNSGIAERDGLEQGEAQAAVALASRWCCPCWNLGPGGGEGCCCGSPHVDSAGIAISMWEVRRAGGGRTASLSVLCRQEEALELYFPSSRRLEKSTLLPEMAFGCFPPRGTGKARLFPRRRPLPKPAWREPVNWDGEFPVPGISRPPEEPSVRASPASSCVLGAASLRARWRCRRRRFPGRRRKRERGGGC